MKTTIELPDQLFAAAKATAVKRRTTLKAMVEHALRREIAFEQASPDVTGFDLNSHGFPVLRKRDSAPMTSEMVYQMIEEEGI